MIQFGQIHGLPERFLQKLFGGFILLPRFSAFMGMTKA
jgi:hypothetical protein